jgi:hypothetical protein
MHENRIRQAASSLGAARVLHRTRREAMPASACCSARRWPRTRRSSSRWSSLPCRGRDAAAADPQDGVGDGSAHPGPGRAHALAPRSRSAISRATTWLCCGPPTARCRCMAGMGYSRHMPFEHIYRHHRRYQASPKAARRSRSGGSRMRCSASAGRLRERPRDTRGRAGFRAGRAARLPARLPRPRHRRAGDPADGRRHVEPPLISSTPMAGARCCASSRA